MKKFLAFVICLISVVFIVTGCSGVDSDNYDDTNDSNGHKTTLITTSVYRTVTGGKATAEIGGFKLSTNDAKIKDGTEIVISQLDNTAGSGNPYLIASSKIYKVHGFYRGDGVFTEDTTLASLEKPVVITIQNDIPGASEYYLGTRTNTGEPWKFTYIKDDNSSYDPLLISSVRCITNAGNKSEFVIHNYCLNLLLYFFFIIDE